MFSLRFMSDELNAIMSSEARNFPVISTPSDFVVNFTPEPA